MCTAVTYKTKDFYFGRTLDYEHSYIEEVTITPRNFPLHFRNGRSVDCHHAIIGMAYVAKNYPLYYDAVNENGLCMAGLNFVGNARYHDTVSDKNNIAPFEFIPWVLSQCTTTDEAIALIRETNLTNTPFSDELPNAELHWIVADKTSAITVESVSDGIKIYDNSIGVLTNNPPFDMQMINLSNYLNLSNQNPSNNFADKIYIETYSRGMGALGLPGDLSSQSRFVRASFTKLNSVSGTEESESTNQFFHILGTVRQTRGCCDIGNQTYEITIYTSCCNATRGIYYYTTYENSQITGVDMNKENLDSTNLFRYPLISTQQLRMQN